MALVLADRVRETTTTTGTGSVTLAGAYTGFQTFSAAVGNTNSTYYTIANVGSGEWEVGIGTYSSGGNLLSRTTVLASSNGGSLVNFGAGAKDVFVTQPAERALYIASAGTGLESKVTAFTNGGIVYASSTSALATGSALVFDGTNLGVGITPTTKLHVSSASNTFATVESTNGAAYWQMIGNNATNASYNSLLSKYGATTDWSISGGNGTTGQMLFNIGGTEGFRLNSTSLYTASAINVGIGTSSPASKLHIESASAESFRIGYSSTKTARLGTTSSGDLQVYAYDSAVGYRNILLAVDSTTSAGNVGIGTSSPSAKLHIYKSSLPAELRIQSGDTQPTVSFYSDAVQTPTRNWAISSSFAAYGDLCFLQSTALGGNPITAGTTRMTLNASGNLGIGVTPSAFSTGKAIELGSVNGNALWGIGANACTLLSNAYFNAGYVYANNGFANRYDVGGAAGVHAWHTAPSGTAGNAITFTQAMTLDASGNLGIGTSSPTAKLEVASDGGTTNAVYITDTRAYSATPQSNILFNFKYTSGGAYSPGAIIRGGKANANDNDYAGELSFWTRINGGNLTQRAIIDSSGNLGLGVTPSVWGSFTGMQIGALGGLSLGGTTDNIFLGSNVYFGSGAFRYAATGYVASNYRQTGGWHYWFTTGTTTGTAGATASFTQAMTLDADGDLGIGQTSPAFKLDVQVAVGGAIAVRPSTSTGNAKQSALRLYGSESVTTSRYAEVACFNDTAGSDTNALTFSTGFGATIYERARISSDGNLLVGTTAAQLDGSSKMVVLNSSATVAEFTASSGTATQAVLRSWNTATSGDNLFQTFHTDAGATQRGSIYYNRTGGLLVYLTTSDYRAKDISGPVIDSGSVIDSVPVYMGKMKDATQERPMFIAHETPAYAHVGEKDAVDADGKPVYQQMDASALVPVMWAEIQSLRKRLATAGI
jgi:hypothetical protein